MANCVNVNTKEFKALRIETGLSVPVLQSKVSLWQDVNGIERFPNKEQIFSFTPMSKRLGIYKKKLSKFQTNLVKKRIATYNKKNNSNVFVTFEQQGQADIYTWDITSGGVSVTTKIPKVEKEKNIRRGVARTDTTLKERLFEGKDEVSAKDILNTIADSNHPLKELAKALSPILGDQNIPVKLQDAFVLDADGNPAIGYFNLTNGDITMADKALYPKGQAESTILHEILHALSYNKLSVANADIIKDFKNLYDYAKKNSNLSETHSYYNMDEFFVAIFTNSDFIKDLKSIPASNTKAYPNAFAEILDKILNVLGLKSEDTAYEQAFNIASNILSTEVTPNSDSITEDAPVTSEEIMDFFAQMELSELLEQTKDRELERQQMEESKWQVDEAIDNYFNNEKRQVEKSRREQLNSLNQEFGQDQNLSEEELNRIDVVNAKHDLQQEVLERTRQARLEDKLEERKDNSNFEEEVIDEAINNNPSLTAASFFTPNYDTYLKDKQALLKKVEKALSKLYTISGKNKTASTISNINKLNNLKNSLQEDILKFEKGTVTESVLEEFFNKDIETINTLLDTNDFDNLYLAQDLLDFLDTNLNIVNSNSMFSGIDEQHSLMKTINKITVQKVQLERKLSNTYDKVFLNLLDKHFVSFKRLSKYKGMTLQEIRDTLLNELRDASIFSNEALAIDKNLTTKADVTRQLARLELELEQEKEKLLITPAINKINNVLEKGQQELKRLGKVTRVLGKNIYNYDLFFQKDSSQNKNYRLINKFSNDWFDYKQTINNVYNKRMAAATDAKERNLILTEQYNEINSNADFVNFTLLHDIFTDNSLDGFKGGNAASASAYKNSLISKIGKENYDDLINEQRTKLQLFLEKRNELVDKKLASLGLNDYQGLPQIEKDKLKITINTIDPLVFIDNHFNYGTNKIPVQLGTQTIEFPAKLNYVSFVPKNTEHFNPEFDVIEQNPILYEMYQAFKEANDVIKDGLLGTGIDLERGQLMHSRKNFRETLMDKSFAELVKNGLGHLLNVKAYYQNLSQFLKDTASVKADIEKNSKEIKVSGQLITAERIANREYRNTVIELKNILNRNLQDTSPINWPTLPSNIQKEILELLDRDNIDDILTKGVFKVKDLKKYAVDNVVAQQSMDLPLLLKANLDLVSEHKARVNSKNTISVLLNRINKKNQESGNQEGKGAVKLEHWVRKNIYNQNINNVQWGNITEKIKGEDNYNKYNGELRRKYYKNFSPAEKKLFDSYTKRIKNIKSQLEDPFLDSSVFERLTKERESLENSIILMGKDYTLGSIAESILIKLPFLAGLAWNQVAPLKNFLNGMVMVLNRDGQFWKEGNANIAMNFVLGHPLKSLGNKFSLNNHQEEWKKAVLFIQGLRVIEDQTSELQRGEEENSKILSTGTFFTDGMYLTKKVEWINQSVSLMSRAQDVMIEHPTQKNSDGSPYTVKMFDGQQFEAHEIVEGQLVLKPEWRSPENISNFEKMDSEQMLLWKVENKRVNASLNGDYSQEGSVMAKRSTLGRVLFQFKTWVSQFLYDRFAYKQTDLALGIEHSGYYVGPIMNTRTRPVAITTFLGKSALAGLVTANFAGGAAIAIPAIAVGYMAYKIRKNRQESALPLLKSIAKGVKDINKKATWEQTKYLLYTPTIGLGVTTANIATGVLTGKNYIPKIITDFEKSMQSEEDKQNFKNLQLLTKSLQANMMTTIVSMLFMALRGTDKDDDEKNKEQDAWYINMILNLASNVYSENNFADNPLLMYQSLIEKQGANSLVDNAVKLSLYFTHLEKDKIQSGENEGDSRTWRQAKKMFLPMMIRNIDKIGTEDYLLGYESLVGKYYKQGSPFEEFFDSDLKRELSKRRAKRADVKEEIRKEVEKYYDIPDTKRAEALLNAKATSGYQNDEVTIEGVPEINRSNYDEEENLIE
jgi:hypothetical protein